MFLTILVFVLSFIFPYFMEPIVLKRKKLFSFLFRFSGTIFLVLFMYGGVVRVAMQQFPSFFLMSISIAFYSLWLYKIIGILMHNQYDNFFMKIVRGYFILWSFLFFPYRVAAKKYYRIFVLNEVSP